MYLLVQHPWATVPSPRVQICRGTDIPNMPYATTYRPADVRSPLLSCGRSVLLDIARIPPSLS